MKIPEKHKAEIESWQNVPITIESVTEEVCYNCPGVDIECQRNNCRGWLKEMGLGPYCYEAYKITKKED